MVIAAMTNVAPSQHQVPKLFAPLALRGVTLRNRIAVSPMCQYSCADDGLATDWHLVHLGARATGGAGLVIAEATAVTAEGRISPADLGIWSDRHIEPLGRIARFITSQGAAPGIQLAHAGRKGSTYAPATGNGTIAAGDGGWTPIAPSAIPFTPNDPPPHALDAAGLAGVTAAFAAAARRAVAAGFTVIEVHAAHGYLLHEFLSPLSNQRSDAYGGSLANRLRFPLEVVRAVRSAVPENLPLLVRVSASDWAEGGWDLAQTIAFSCELKNAGVDLVDTSSGGLVPNAKIALGPGYQVPFASAIRREAGIYTGAVGLITDAGQAERILADGAADLILLARQFLRDPSWALHAAENLGHHASWPTQYARAAPSRR
jgi:2,4-dienoyl-CoA reductase-like NADH-dependent reductase (Old Yellow Enzyme family)